MVSLTYAGRMGIVFFFVAGFLLGCGDSQGVDTGDGGSEMDSGATGDGGSEMDSGATGDGQDAGIEDSGGMQDAGLDAGYQLEPVEFSWVTTGAYFTCGLRTTGKVDCWGYLQGIPSGIRLPPSEVKFTSISDGKSNTCGITQSNKVVCWPDPGDEGDPPDGKYKQVVSDPFVSCALGIDGEVDCWGKDATSPSGEFLSLAEGDYIYCGVLIDNSVTCWKTGGVWEKFPVEGSFKYVITGPMHGCGLQVDDTVKCWGSDTEGQAIPPTGTFKMISGRGSLSCGVRFNNDVECWGRDNSNKPPPDSKLVQISVGNYHSCGVTEDSEIRCWGADDLGQSTFTEGISFRQVAAGGGVYGSHVDRGDNAHLGCGLDTDGRAHCWSTLFDKHTSEITTYEGRFKELCVAMEDVCGLTEDGTIICSGLALSGFKRSGDFRTIDCAGFVWENGNPDARICALDKDGILSCWSGDSSPMSTIPKGPFVDVSTGVYSGCGLRSDGKLDCWSPDNDEFPIGEFKQVSAGGSFLCGLRTNGTIECWGGNSYGQENPPDGEFTTITSGEYHACGLRPNGSVECWGQTGEIAIPKGFFKQIAAGYGYTCGVKNDTSLACWGALTRGLTMDDFN